MNRLARTVLAGACVLAAAGPFAPAARSAPAPELVTLRNGLRVVLAPDSAATAVDVSVSYAAGARSIPASAEGVRHVLERLLFLGGADGARVRALTAEGGTAGSMTTADAIEFWETMPAEALALALHVEAQRMAPGRATPQAFAVARAAAAADARARGAFSPLAAGLTRLAATVFAGGPYARPLVPADAQIAAVDPVRAEAWRAGHLVPANAVLVIAGRFERAATLERVRHEFEALPRGVLAPLPPPAPAVHPAHRVTAAGDVPLPMLFAGWRVPGGNDPDAAAINLVAAAIGGGEDSHLNHALTVDAKVAIAGQCDVDRRRDASMLWAAVVPASAADSAQAETVLLDEVARLAHDPLPDAEFQRVRARFVTAQLFREQDPRARAQALADAVLAGRAPASADTRLAALDRLAPADLQRVARRILTDDSRTVLWLAPRGGAR